MGTLIVKELIISSYALTKVLLGSDFLKQPCKISEKNEVEEH